ncbi:sigma-54-dependent Fis family transcriptional regulator [Crenobacter luteus]|uniref:sigma-54-dependent Fis family transcriptional regulator n=1 Tax=Crenobacter luteus TaxID=1452487 RepID=UPI0009EDF6F5|nr:sigma-54-dependent Fis family transcriptional regulator [Crenobacter luteus]
MNRPFALPLSEARRRFFDGEALPQDALPSSILHSWQRCLGLGLPVSGRRHERLSDAALAERRDANADWLAVARPYVETLFEQVVDGGHVVVLADRDGLILDEMGNAGFLDKAERVALTPGMDWGEGVRGTNAIGTALTLAETVRVRGGEHYLECNRLLSCTASPLLDPTGRPVGVLDVSGAPRKLGPDETAAVDATARLIERRLFDAHAQGARVLLLHPDPAQLATPRAARLAFGDDETLIGADRAALSLLAQGWGAVGRARFAELFGETLDHWQSRAGHGVALLAPAAGRPLSARLLAPARPATAPTPAPQQARPTSSPPAKAPAPEAAEADVAGLPPALLETARKLLEADIPVLVLGETGTGKDRFARALHAASSRRHAPFVAVNCAAIPDGLVEAELFGYEEGAFTGARRQGSRGRLREAHGGVLFLDEIGDMPLTLQARLLRALQERVVTPLGGGQPQRVDVRLVCATHRDLRRMVDEGAFRADLYFRLGHYPLRLPPLRTRGDVAAIAQRLLDVQGAARRGIALAPDLAAAIRRYPWPGNLRELDNLLRTLLALVDDGTLLGPEHLPETLREDMGLCEAGAQEPDDATAQLLARFGGNASAAARALGISRSTLYRRLRKNGR